MEEEGTYEAIQGYEEAMADIRQEVIDDVRAEYYDDETRKAE